MSNDMQELKNRIKAVYKEASDQASKYVQQAAKQAKEIDWERLRQDTRTTFESAMASVEENIRKYKKKSEAAAGSTAQGDAAAGKMQSDEMDARRREILEGVRTGRFSLEEAEKMLDELQK